MLQFHRRPTADNEWLRFASSLTFHTGRFPGPTPGISEVSKGKSASSLEALFVLDMTFPSSLGMNRRIKEIVSMEFGLSDFAQKAMDCQEFDFLFPAGHL